MGASTQLKDMYAKLVGLSDIGVQGAAASGSLGEQLAFIQAKVAGSSKVEQYPGGGAVGFATASFKSVIVPATQPGSINCPPAIHPDGTYVIHGLTASPWIAVYPITGTTIGTKLADPATSPGTAPATVSFSPNGNWIAVGRNSAVDIYAFDKVNGIIGARSADPGTAWDAATNKIDWHPNSSWILTSLGATSPYVRIRGFNATTGVIATAPISNPAAIPTCVGTLQSARFSPSGKHVAVGGSFTPYLEMYPFDAVAGAWGAKFANPGTLPISGTTGGVVLLDDFVVTGNQSPTTQALEGWPYTATAFGTKVAVSGVAGYGNWASDIVVNQLKTHIFVLTLNGANSALDVFPFTSAGFGTKVTLAGPLGASNNALLVGPPVAVGSVGEIIPMGNSITATKIGNYPFVFGVLWTPIISVVGLDFTAITGACRLMIQNAAGVWSDSMNFEVGTHNLNVAALRVLFGSVVASAKGQVTGFGN